MEFGLRVTQESMPEHAATVVWSEEHGLYLATTPAFPDLTGTGPTRDEAVANLREEIIRSLPADEAGPAPEKEPPAWPKPNWTVLPMRPPSSPAGPPSGAPPPPPSVRGEGVVIAAVGCWVVAVLLLLAGLTAEVSVGYIEKVVNLHGLHVQAMLMHWAMTLAVIGALLLILDALLGIRDRLGILIEERGRGSAASALGPPPPAPVPAGVEAG